MRRRTTLLGTMAAGFMWVTIAQAQLGGGGGVGGVYVDAQGILRRMTTSEAKANAAQSDVAPSFTEEIAARSDLRRISLRGLDRQLRRARDAGQPLAQELEYLAGLVKIEYVVIDPEHRDVVLVGPAEGWKYEEGRAVGRSTNRPVVHLEDLAAALHCVLGGPGVLECSIHPSKDGFERFRTFASKVEAPKNGREGQRVCEQAADAIGLQSVMTGGVPRGSRASLVMIAADYLMKQMAVGIVKFAGIYSHAQANTDRIKQGIDTPRMSRWWFSPLYEPFVTDSSQRIYKFRGQGVQLLSDEQVFDRNGSRRTVNSDDDNDRDRFAATFTNRFDRLERRFPEFAELHNLFDLMFVAELVRQRGGRAWFSDSLLLDKNLFASDPTLQPTRAEALTAYDLFTRREGGRRYRYVTVAFGGVYVRPAVEIAARDITIDVSGALDMFSGALVDPLETAAVERASDVVLVQDEPAPSKASPHRWWADVSRVRDSAGEQ